jgi:FtsP/CotA-like multicopper oxidase with cupredoxin domain
LPSSARPSSQRRSWSLPRWARIVLPLVATAAILAPLAYLWQTSRLPAVYSVMDMGYPDYGGGPSAMHRHSSGGHSAGGGAAETVWVPDLVEDPHRRADVRWELVTRAADLSIGGKTVPGFTVNGTSPGPTITARQGQLVEVTVRNESVPAGVAMHWHGLDVPNAMDGVAGVTQNAIGVGESFTYRFVVDRIGTYWYHSHQVSNDQVVRGLFGPLIVKPTAVEKAARFDLDLPAVAHTYGGVRTLNGRPGDAPVPARPGQRVRVRVINTDNAPMEVWAGAPYRVQAVDGTEVHGPTPISGTSVTLTAGGRADLAVTMPADGTPVRVQLSKATAVVLGRPGVVAPAAPQPPDDLDLLAYGSKGELGFDPARAARRFDYVVGHVPGFVKGRPGMWWSINGHLFPDVPMYVVRRGETIRMRIENRSGEVHPMHLHGHRAVVLSRNGVAASGSPWWVDSLNVGNNETFEIAFVADNPGIWMDHCHNLRHAAQGLVAHLMFEGFDTPYRISGPAANEPE